MLPFPERFNFSHDAWAGPRATVFARREDAFQQLVGDALREELGAGVRVMPTEGRDGGIDVLLENDVRLPFVSRDLAGPVIVECKDNDDARGRALENVRAAWKKVEEKLAKQSAAGWPGPYRPWATARTYLYLTSAVLPNQEARNRLQQDVEQFFQRLRRDGRTTIEHPVIADWADLRPFLDRNPRLADRWLGLGRLSLRSQAEQLASLRGVSRYLVDLPFIAPGRESQTHPDRLLAHVLERAGEDRGVLIVGAGGVGKTRTLLEVGQRADAQGWRVLHVLSGDPPLSSSDLIQEVVDGRRDTLVLCDYFDQLALDVVSIRQRLLPAARQRGLKVAILASARTPRDARRSRNPDFFAVVRLALETEQAQRLAGTMEQQIAPQAVRMLGEEKVRKLTGDQPMIALLVLKEIERLAATRKLTRAQDTTVRPGELRHWLERRLAEDELVADTGSSRWDEEATSHVLGAAAALAFCPARPKHVHAVITCVIAEENKAKAADQAERIVQNLIELGWLRNAEGKLTVAHDVVTDQLLEQALRTTSDAVRMYALRRLLRPCARSPAVLARFATALRRVITAGGPFVKALERCARAWLRKASPALGRMLAGAPAPKSSAALWAMLRGSPWKQTTIACWDQIVAPWLDQHGASSDAWPPLYALCVRKNLPEPYAARALEAAIAWIEQHHEDEHAASILLMLLDRPDLGSAIASRLFELAWSWYERYRQRPSAALVLGGILERTEVPPALIERLGPETLRWWVEHPEVEETGLPLGMLLRREDTSSALSQRLEGASWEWLERHRDARTAGYVLHGLLLACDEESARWHLAVDAALRWLDIHADTAESGLVLGSLLLRGESIPEQLPAVLDAAWAWFKRRRRSFHVSFILHGLLTTSALDPDRFVQAAKIALGWAAAHDRYPQATILLYLVPRRGDLDAEHAGAIDREACSILQKGPDLSLSGLLLGILLDRGTLPDDVAPRVAELALDWLEKNVGGELNWWVLATSIACPHVDVTDARRLAVNAIAQAESSAVRNVDGAVLGSIIHRIGIETPLLRRASALMTRWLDGHASDPTAIQAYRLLLVRTDLDPGLMARLVEGAQLWLEQHGDTLGAVAVIAPLLAREDLAPECQARAETLAMNWLEQHNLRFEAFNIINVLLATSRSTNKPGVSIAAAARKWLQWHSRHPLASSLITNLIPPPAEPAIPEDIQTAISWLEAHGDKPGAFELLLRLSARRDLNPRTASFVVSTGLSWLSAHPHEESAALLISALLDRPEADTSTVVQLVSRAAEWLDTHELSESSGYALAGLMFAAQGRPELAHSIDGRGPREAVEWLRDHASTHIAGPVIALLYSRKDVARTTLDAAGTSVKQWLGEHAHREESWWTLTALLQHRKLQRGLARRVVQKAVEWVGHHADADHAYAVLNELVGNSLLEKEEDVRAVFLAALRWLGEHVDTLESQQLSLIVFNSASLGESGARADRHFVEALVDAVATSVKAGDFEDACRAMPALLVAAARSRAPALKRRARVLVARALRDRRMHRELRRRMAGACQRLLEADAWPDPAGARQLLSELRMAPALED
ncbi:hypothetical protein [Sorangium sp. So ce362]|uniref:P-loop NTPase n=1 Tax=Sorangium sp. So ce362 TaxID=3133303 RepID=UPI003F5FFF95